MRTKKFKWGNPLFVAFLAVAGIFGVSSALINKQVEETPVVEKAEAAGDHVIYYATTTQRSDYYTDEKYNNAGGDGWRGFHSLTEVGKCGDYYIYKATTYEEYGGLHGLWVRHGTGGTGGAHDATLIEYDNTNMTSYSVYENKVWYSSAWKSIYTITYNPNGATGSTKTDYKIEGVSYSILSYASAGISSHAYKHAHKWSTRSDGDETLGTDYQPGATYSTNANLSLHFIETWYTYQFKVNSGEWNTLTKAGDTPDGYVAKFTAIHSFTAGDTVTFRKKYGTETPISISPSSYEENIGTGGAIYYSAENTYIDLKLTSTNGHTIKVGGFAERGISIERGGHSYKCAAVYDGTNNQFIVYGITVLVGDTIKATYQGQTPYTIYVENIDVYGVSRDGVVNTPGVFDIYLKLNEYSQFNNVHLSMNDSSTATLIAQTFNNALETVCTRTVAGGDASDITSAFSTQSGYYSHLTTNCKNILNGTTSSSDSDVIAMQAKYDYIVGKYGITVAPDYLGRNPAPLSLAIRDFTPFTLINGSEDSLSTVIIIIASSVALLSVTALSILVIKKRKAKED